MGCNARDTTAFSAMANMRTELAFMSANLMHFSAGRKFWNIVSESINITSSFPLFPFNQKLFIHLRQGSRPCVCVHLREFVETKM